MTINIGRTFYKEFVIDNRCRWWAVSEDPRLKIGDPIKLLVDDPGASVNLTDLVEATNHFKGSVTAVIPPMMESTWAVNRDRRLLNIPIKYESNWIICFTGGFINAATP